MKDLIKKLYNFCIEWKNVMFSLKEIKKICNERTYYDEERRKSKIKRTVENIIWSIKYREINSFYNLYGMDTYKKIKKDDYFNYLEFRKIRDKGNLKNKIDSRILLRDKNIFGKILTQSNIKTPKIIFFINKGNIYNIKNKLISIEQMIDLKIDGFLKKIDGECGEDIYKIIINEKKIYLNSEKTTKDYLIKIISNGKFILQERLNQHEKLAKLNPTSVNTLRIVTVKTQDKIEVFSELLRIGTASSRIDNWATGGIVVGIKNGFLEKESFYKPGYGGMVLKHPDTGIFFEGYKLPFYKESIELVKELHDSLFDIESIGWDVAITTSGPTILEGNDNWEIALHQVIEGGLKNRWLKLINGGI